MIVNNQLVLTHQGITNFTRDFATYVNHYQVIVVDGFPENQINGLSVTQQYSQCISKRDTVVLLKGNILRF